MSANIVLFKGGSDIVSARGKVIGHRLAFAGQGRSAKSIKEALKAKGLKGAKLTDETNRVLRGEVDLRWAAHDAAVSVMRSNGYVPDVAEARKGTGVVRFVKPAEPKKPSEVAAAAVAKMSDAERQELVALLLGNLPAASAAAGAVAK